MNETSNLPISETLCSIGALCKVCGVTRRMVLNYEAHGLIQPLSVGATSGHRHYGAQSVARIRHIKILQSLGLSLEEIGQFMGGNQEAVAGLLGRLRGLRETLDVQIDRTEALLTPKGEFAIRRTTLPGGNYAVTTEPCGSAEELFFLLWRFTARVLKKGWRVADSGQLTAVLYLDSEGSGFQKCSVAWEMMEPNEESAYFESVQALFTNVKGPYTQVFQAIQVLRRYAAEHGLREEGKARLTFLTSPQSHLSPEDYVTQVYLPFTPQE